MCVTNCWDHFKATNIPVTRISLGRRPGNASLSVTKNRITLSAFKCFGQYQGEKGEHFFNNVKVLRKSSKKDLEKMNI
jgi:hypothetical protein